MRNCFCYYQCFTRRDTRPRRAQTVRHSPRSAHARPVSHHLSSSVFSVYTSIRSTPCTISMSAPSRGLQVVLDVGVSRITDGTKSFLMLGASSHGSAGVGPQHGERARGTPATTGSRGGESDGRRLSGLHPICIHGSSGVGGGTVFSLHCSAGSPRAPRASPRRHR